MNSPYSPEFIESQKQLLLKDKDRIIVELSKVAEYNEEDDKYIPKFEEFSPGEGEDSDESADEATNYEENAALMSDLVKSLGEVNDALAKITSGKYGYCANCNSYIPEDRLKAYPAAATCIEC